MMLRSDFGEGFEEALGLVAKMRDDSLYQHPERRVHALIEMIERKMNDAAEDLRRRQLRECEKLMTLCDQSPVRVDGTFRVGARARGIDDGRGVIRANLPAKAQIFVRTARDRGA